jgi:hypothetical protein
MRRRGILMFGLVFLAACLPSTSRAADEATLRAWKWAEQQRGMPANRCRLSRYYLRQGDLLEKLPEAEEVLTDGDPQTGLTLPAGSEALEIHFVGAPRWVNEIRVLAEVESLRVWVMDLDGAWQPFGGRGERRPGGILLFRDTDQSIRALRLETGPSDRNPGEITIREVDGRHVSFDPDRGSSSGGDDGKRYYHYDYVNDYPARSGARDLHTCDNNVRGLKKKLPGSWNTVGHADENAVAAHARSASYGGNEDDHVDHGDLSFFCGHGYGSSPYTGMYFYDDGVVAYQCKGSWGDTDMEWFASPACQFLHLNAVDNWAEVMNGQHLICGGASDMRAGNYGKAFGKYLVSTGPSDPAKKVKVAWFLTVEKRNGGGATGVVIGEAMHYGEEYIWGEGSVYSDPTHDDTYVLWAYVVGGTSWTDTRTTAAAARVAGNDTTVVLPAPSPQGLSIAVSRGLLETSPWNETLTVPSYEVTEAYVDSFTVRSTAERFCRDFGILCGGDILPGDDDEMNLVVGAYELRFCRTTGVFEFEDSKNWLASRTTPPRLPDEDTSVQRAEEILAELGAKPEDAVFDGVDSFWQIVRNSATGETDPDSTFPLSRRVRYRRQLPAGSLGSLPVEGPGGFLAVELGEDGRLLRISRPGWHPVRAGEPVTVRPLADALSALAEHGAAVTVGGLPSGADSVRVEAAGLAYYEPASDEELARILPVYRLDVTVFGPGEVERAAQILVWADPTPPRVEIAMPQDSLVVAPGTLVCFEAFPVQGTAPFRYQWTDEHGNVLGETAAFCREIYPAETDEGEADDVRTIKVTMWDATGREDAALVKIVLATGQGEAQPSQEELRVRLTGARPNPFRPDGKILFEIPASAGPSVFVDLGVYDVSGRRVKQLVRGELTPGSYAITWNGRDDGNRTLSSGIYFYRLRVGGKVAQGKMILVK